MTRQTQMVLASSNPGKIKEINQLTLPQGIKVIPQSALNIQDAAETGLTFIENALIKARHAAAVTDLPVMADDSGLVVAQLQGKPGIHSARYAGSHASDSENIAKLLQSLEGTPSERRNAFFYCVIVVLQGEKDPCPIICEGVWHGSILEQPKGNFGFGYDPVFFDSLHQVSAAELQPTIKNKISHRGQAIQKLLQRLTA